VTLDQTINRCESVEKIIAEYREKRLDRRGAIERMKGLRILYGGAKQILDIVDAHTNETEQRA